MFDFRANVNKICHRWTNNDKTKKLTLIKSKSIKENDYFKVINNVKKEEIKNDMTRNELYQLFYIKNRDQDIINQISFAYKNWKIMKFIFKIFFI